MWHFVLKKIPKQLIRRLVTYLELAYNWKFLSSDLDQLTEEDLTVLKDDILSDCLKKSGHGPNKDAIYETPSDYDPFKVIISYTFWKSESKHLVQDKFNNFFLFIIVLNS